ncbi:MAG TPA: hypothetical protein DCS55_20495 [Acidimicrobiaceae bacterium]|nr:hypothetical protein [Acidimicrobiaceae bacterium]
MNDKQHCKEQEAGTHLEHQAGKCRRVSLQLHDYVRNDERKAQRARHQEGSQADGRHRLCEPFTEYLDAIGHEIEATGAPWRERRSTKGSQQGSQRRRTPANAGGPRNGVTGSFALQRTSTNVPKIA